MRTTTATRIPILIKIGYGQALATYRAFFGPVVINDGDLGAGIPCQRVTVLAEPEIVSVTPSTTAIGRFGAVLNLTYLILQSHAKNCTRASRQKMA